MKLFVIVLCLLSERYLVHTLSHNRFNWFPSFFNNLCQRLPQHSVFLNPAVMLAIIVLPFVILCGLVLFIFNHLLFGVIAFLLNLAIFYYCLGPENPFYPVREEGAEEYSEAFVGHYFAAVNGQLFAAVFWYIVTGALGVLIYRLISLCRGQELTAKIASQITDILDWIPARLTTLLYLLVGNFQQGFHFFTQKFLSSPEHNENLLSTGGLLAARTNASEPVLMPYAESLVEHAMIVYLVFLAFFTLVAWL